MQLKRRCSIKKKETRRLWLLFHIVYFMKCKNTVCLPEDSGSVLPQNVGNKLPGHTAHNTSAHYEYCNGLTSAVFLTPQMLHQDRELRGSCVLYFFTFLCAVLNNCLPLLLFCHIVTTQKITAYIPEVSLHVAGSRLLQNFILMCQIVRRYCARWLKRQDTWLVYNGMWTRTQSVRTPASCDVQSSALD